jgi:hypothetical protein
MFGTGFHSAIKEGLQDFRSRYDLERYVEYKGIGGRCDIYDKYKHRLTDWKTTALQRIRKYRADGPPTASVVQGQIYAAGLQEAGERVDQIVLAYIPRDGELSNIYCYVDTPRREVADEAIDVYRKIETRLANGETPGDIEAWPSGLCPYCPNFQANVSAKMLDVACPGREET